MANISKLSAGAQDAWSTSLQAGFSSGDITSFNSLASGSCVIATSAIAQGTNLDLFGEISLALTASASTTSTSVINLYLLPLNQDASTYGDNASGGTTVPTNSYLAGIITCRTGITAVVGNTKLFNGDYLPRGNFKLCIQPVLGAALAASAGAVISYRSTALNLNA